MENNNGRTSRTSTEGSRSPSPPRSASLPPQPSRPTNPASYVNSRKKRPCEFLAPPPHTNKHMRLNFHSESSHQRGYCQQGSALNPVPSTSAWPQWHTQTLHSNGCPQQWLINDGLPFPQAAAGPEWAAAEANAPNGNQQEYSYPPPFAAHPPAQEPEILLELFGNNPQCYCVEWPVFTYRCVSGELERTVWKVRAPCTKRFPHQRPEGFQAQDFPRGPSSTAQYESESGSDYSLSESTTPPPEESVGQNIPYPELPQEFPLDLTPNEPSTSFETRFNDPYGPSSSQRDFARLLPTTGSLLQPGTSSFQISGPLGSFSLPNPHPAPTDQEEAFLHSALRRDLERAGLPNPWQVVSGTLSERENQNAQVEWHDESNQNHYEVLEHPTHAETGSNNQLDQAYVMFTYSCPLILRGIAQQPSVPFPQLMPTATDYQRIHQMYIAPNAAPDQESGQSSTVDQMTGGGINHFHPPCLCLGCERKRQFWSTYIAELSRANSNSQLFNSVPATPARATSSSVGAFRTAPEFTQTAGWATSSSVGATQAVEEASQTAGWATSSSVRTTQVVEEASQTAGRATSSSVGATQAVEEASQTAGSATSSSVGATQAVEEASQTAGSATSSSVGTTETAPELTETVPALTETVPELTETFPEVSIIVHVKKTDKPPPIVIELSDSD